MATRYVWGKYGVQAVTENETSGSAKPQLRWANVIPLATQPWTWRVQSSTWSTDYFLENGPVYAYCGSNYSLSNGKFSISSPTITTLKNGDNFDLSIGGKGGLAIYTKQSSSSITLYVGISKTNANSFDKIYRVYGDPVYSYNDNIGFSLGIYNTNANTSAISFWADISFDGYWSGTQYGVGQGSSTGAASNSSSSAYPQNGVSGSSWYVYQGSDSIDATAVGYSNQSPMGGQPITINVTPTTPTYGGTIQYTYQVQLSGGSWTTIATKTTATSQQYTIPAGTTSFAARVVANDTWGFSSSTYTTGSTLTVTNNLPPTAPGSISIGSVIGGQQCTITWTAATDPDGTVASYQLERQTDNGDTWTQIYSGADLTYTDTINADWATVNYRVKATDDDGDSGPYATGTMQTVNDGWLYFSGPPSDMGEQPAPFDFVFSIGSTGTTSASNIAVTVIYDDETIYTGTVASAQQITLPIDTRLTYAGDHDIIVTASADGFLAVTQQCVFQVPAVTLPDGGGAGFMEDDAGKAYYPATLARFVIGLKGLDANALFDRVYTGTYTGTGTSGSGNPCSVRTSFEPTLVFIQAAAASTATSGYWVNSAPGQSSQGNMIVNNNGTVTLCPVTWDAEAMTLSWYGTSAAAQLNASGTVYGIIALGGMA